MFSTTAFSDSDSSRFPLATGSEIQSDSTSWKVSIGRVTLTQGSSLSAHLIDGSETVVVESGALLVAGIDCESTCVATKAGSSQTVLGEMLLQETQGFSASQSATVSYEPVGASASFLVITISLPEPGQPVS